ncbi:MAG TPA: hypothetical protein PLH39_00770, partial [Promineifilum sp.]|nr:hypothetical protein [Promineifilum sp.]
PLIGSSSVTVGAHYFTFFDFFLDNIDGKPIFKRVAIAARFSPLTWSNSRTLISVSPQTTHG